jgi:hypothetical protein
MTPWSIGRQHLTLFRNKSKGLCLQIPSLKNGFKNKILVSTIPKSGTGLVAKILTELGFERVRICGFDNMFADFRVLSIMQHTPIRDLTPFCQSLPCEIYYDLVLPGQFVMTHLEDSEKFRHAHNEMNFLLCIRNIRFSLISLLRYLNRNDRGEIPKQDDFTSNDFVQFIKTDFHVDHLLSVSRFVNKILDYTDINLLRFEELTSNDRNYMKPSLKSISNVTGLAEDIIYLAVKKSCGSKTSTYSGQLSQLEEFWTNEVEEAFISRGFDVLNKKFGYEL